jgi:hypothetical protein
MAADKRSQEGFSAGRGQTEFLTREGCRADFRPRGS